MDGFIIIGVVNNGTGALGETVDLEWETSGNVDRVQAFGEEQGDSGCGAVVFDENFGGFFSFQRSGKYRTKWSATRCMPPAWACC